MKIANRDIGPEHPPLVIAEIGINHGGDLDVAKKMVRFSAESPLQQGDILSKGKKVGTLTSAANAESGSVGLGYVRTRTLDSAEIKLMNGGSQLHIQPNS